MDGVGNMMTLTLLATLLSRLGCWTMRPVQPAKQELAFQLPP